MKIDRLIVFTVFRGSFETWYQIWLKYGVESIVADPILKHIFETFLARMFVHLGVWDIKLNVFEFPVHLKWFQVILGISLGFFFMFYT